MLEQLETILICFRNKGRPKYLHVLRYSNEEGGEDGEEDGGDKNDRWEATMRRVTTRMEKILDLASAQQGDIIEVKKQMMDMSNSYQQEIRDMKELINTTHKNTVDLIKKSMTDKMSKLK